MNKPITATRAIYSVMVNDILDGITSGELKEGDRLPSEPVLKDQYSISINSVRKGIAALIEGGFVERRHGSGTYISSTKVVVDLPTKRDNIAVYLAVKLNSYHPYFSEVFNGLQHGLVENGWVVNHIEQSINTGLSSEVHPYDVDRHFVLKELLENPTIAGAVLGQRTLEDPEIENRIHGRFPIVSMSAVKGYSYVDYDFASEALRAISDLKSRGIKKIWAYGRSKNAFIDDLSEFQRDIYKGVLEDITFFDQKHRNYQSEFIYDAFQAAVNTFQDTHKYDGVLVFNDFATRGVMDGLMSLGINSKSGVAISALINRKSEFNETLPFTAYVADGFQKGLTLAQLMHLHIIDPKATNKAVTLSCTKEEIR